MSGLDGAAARTLIMPPEGPMLVHESAPAWIAVESTADAAFHIEIINRIGRRSDRGARDMIYPFFAVVVRDNLSCETAGANQEQPGTWFVNQQAH